MVKHLCFIVVVASLHGVILLILVLGGIPQVYFTNLVCVISLGFIQPNALFVYPVIESSIDMVVFELLQWSINSFGEPSASWRLAAA